MKKFSFAFLFAFLTILLAQPNGAALAQNQEQPADKRHPSYSLMGRDVPAADSPLSPNFMATEESRMVEGGFWYSSFLPERLVGLAAYDIDGDGANEVVYASNQEVKVTRYAVNSLSTLAAFAVHPGETIISVDALDLTGDDRMEIIISVQNSAMKAASRILSFSDGQITELAARLPWYLRVVGGPGTRFLVGQREAATAGRIYGGEVMRMTFDGSTVQSQGPVGLPDFVHVFNFAVGALGRGQQNMIAAVKYPSENLLLYEGGQQIWTSREEYGGTMNSLVRYNPSETKADREFLPARIVFADIDQDGQNELIMAKNYRGGVPFMSSMRTFDGGAMEVFKYSNLALILYYNVLPPLQGGAVDYQVVDFKNNGIPELLVATVIEPGNGMMTDARSRFVAYEIRPAGK